MWVALIATLGEFNARSSQFLQLHNFPIPLLLLFLLLLLLFLNILERIYLLLVCFFMAVACPASCLSRSPSLCLSLPFSLLLSLLKFN